MEEERLAFIGNEKIAKMKIDTALEQFALIKGLDTVDDICLELFDWYKKLTDMLRKLFKFNKPYHEYIQAVYDLTFSVCDGVHIFADYQGACNTIDRIIEIVEDMKNEASMKSIQTKVSSLVEKSEVQSKKALTLHRHNNNTQTKISNLSEKPEVQNKKVFIVHGHNNEMKEAVARFINKIGYKEFILHEQSNAGRTVIEKLEQIAKNAAFAIILLSPDDEGYLKSQGESFKKDRARQNVIFEHGYFMGLIGRNKVAALLKQSNNFEKPSDIDGVLYIDYDSKGYWRHEIANEMTAAGLKVDKNNI